MDALAPLLTLGGTAIGVVVWAVRLEGKVKSHDRELQIIRDDIKYVRRRIDEAIRSAGPTARGSDATRHHG